MDKLLSLLNKLLSAFGKTKQFELKRRDKHDAIKESKHEHSKENISVADVDVIE